jgi:hypothetical protein
MADLSLEFAVVRKQQQTLRIVVKATGRVDRFYIHKLSQSPFAGGVGELAQHLEGLVQYNQSGGHYFLHLYPL